MAHNHNQGHNHEVMNYNHNKEGTPQTEQNQHTTKEKSTYYNQNNTQCVNLQYARQNNQPYANRSMGQPANNYRYRYDHPYATKQQNLNHYQQQQQQNYAHQHYGPSGYNQQQAKQKYKNQQYVNQLCMNQQHIIQQLANQEYMNQQHMNQQHMNQQHMNQQHMNQQHMNQHIIQHCTNQQQPCQKPPIQQNDCKQPPQEESNCNPNQQNQNQNTDSQNQPIKKSTNSNPIESITCTKKIRVIKCKPKTERSKIRIIKTKSKIYKCKCKPCTCKIKPCKCKRIICKCKPLACKCKTLTCKCKPSTSKCKPSTSKCKPCVCKIKPCKCQKIKIKICQPCSRKVNNDNNKPCTDQNKKKNKQNADTLKVKICNIKCSLEELDQNKEEDKCDIGEQSKVQIDSTKAKMDLDQDPNCKSKVNDDEQKLPNLDELCQHTCLCELHSKDILKQSDSKSIPEQDNKSHGILKKNTEYHQQDEDSRLLLPKNQSNAHPDQQYKHNYICECHSKGMKTSQKKTTKLENNKNQEQRFNSKYQNDNHMSSYQATIQRKNTLPHYHIDKNRVLLPKNNYNSKNKDRQNNLYELHTHDFSKKQNEMLINQARVSGKSEACNQENQKSTLNHHDDQSKIQLTNETKNQQDQESRQSCLEGNPKDINIQLNEITKNQEKLQGLDEKQDKLGGENTKDLNKTDKTNEIHQETEGDSTLKSSKPKSGKLQYLQQKRRDMIQDSISFCSVM